MILDGILENNEMQFGARLLLETDSGKVQFVNNKIKISDAKSVTLKLVAGTDYMPAYPVYKGNDYKSQNLSRMASVKDKSFDILKKEHIDDYQQLFKRVNLSLEATEIADLPTDND